MKKKKVLSILLAMLMLLSTMFSASAVFAAVADVSIVVSTDKATAMVGDVVTFTVKLNAAQANTNINSAAVIVEFNQNDFELATGNYVTDITVNSAYIPFAYASTSGPTNNLISYKYLLADPNVDRTINNDTNLITVKLKTKNSEGIKTINVKPEAQFSNLNFDFFSVATGTITCNVTSPEAAEKAEAITQFKAVRDNVTTGVDALKATAETAKNNATLIASDAATKVAVDTKVTAVNNATKTDVQLVDMANAAAVNTAKTALQTALTDLQTAITTLNDAQTAAQNAATTKSEAITQFKAVRDNVTTGVDALKATAETAKNNATLIASDAATKVAVDAKVAAVNAATKNNDQLELMADALAVTTAKGALQTALTELSTAITALNNAQAAAVAANLNAVTSYANSLTTIYTIYGDQDLQVILNPAVPQGISVSGIPTITERPASQTSTNYTLTIAKGGQSVTKTITVVVKPALNQLQKVVVAALSADGTARTNFVNDVLVKMVSVSTTITSDMYAKTRALGITESMMANAEIANALKMYAPYTSTQKTAVQAAIQLGLPAENTAETAGIPGLKGTINGEITGNPNNNVGISLFKAMVTTMRSITSAPIAKDKGSNGAQIDFDLTGHETIKATLSNLINAIDSLKDTVASSDGATNIDKLFNYAENLANTTYPGEVASFKSFLGTAYTKTYTPPVDNTPDPQPTPVVNPVVDPVVGKSGDDMKKAAEGNAPVDPTAVKNAINQATAALTNTNADENKQTANIGIVANEIIANASKVVAKVTNAAEKEELIATTSNAITAVVEAAAKVGTEANAIELAKSFKTIAQEITTLTTLTTNTATQQKLADQQDKIVSTMKTVAQNVIQNAGTYKTPVNENGGVAVVTLTQQAVTDLLAKADAVVTTANNLSKAIADSGLNVAVEKKLLLDVATSGTAKNLTTELPANVLDQVKAKGISTVEIKSGVAQIAVSPDFITKTANTQAVALEVQKVALTDSIINTMNAQQKALVQNASEIYDFNAMLKDASNNETKVTSFNSDIKISLPYTLKAGESKDNITILYLADDGTVQNMAGVYDEATKTVVFKTNHFSKYLIKNNVVTFSDIPAGYWAKAEIESMASKGIISGNLGKYLPANNITRAEFAKLITTALNIVDKSATAKFTDVQKDAWYYEYVASAVKAGVITGKGDGTFAPNETISRQDMATMLSRALIKIKGQTNAAAASSAISSFADVSSISSYAVDGVATAVKNSLITGKPGNKVDPLGKVTRAEAAVTIYRLFNK